MGPVTGANNTDTEEVSRLREENAKLVAKMREILVRYKAMQEQLSGGAGAAGAGAGGGGGRSESEQKLVGKLKEIVGKYKVGCGFCVLCVCMVDPHQ